MRMTMVAVCQMGTVLNTKGQKWHLVWRETEINCQ